MPRDKRACSTSRATLPPPSKGCVLQAASFDGDGKLTTDFGFYDESYGVAIQSDGKIAVVGMVDNGDFGLARYNPDGSLDTTFDGDGKLTTDFGFDDYSRGVAIQSDGKLIVAGFTGNANGFDSAMARYNLDGSLDASFDSDGKVTTDFGGFDHGQGVAVQPDSKLIMVGHVNTGSNSDFALARYNTDGSLDTTFDSDGKITTDFFGNLDYGLNVDFQSDGKIIAVGCAHNDNSVDFALARYNHDGSLDTTFDSDGKATTDFGFDDYGQDVAIQSDGKIIATGFAADAMWLFDFAVARYLAAGGSTFIYDPNGQFEWLAAGEVATDTFTYVASDGSLTGTATVSITVAGVNDAPVLGAIGNKSVAEGIRLTFTVTATDVDLPDSLTFTLDAGAPGGASITPGGEFAWTPDEAQGPGVYTATIRVTDSGAPPLDDAETITLIVEEVNTAPMLAPIGDKTVNVSTTLIFSATATDSDIPSNTLTFSLGTGAPAGASINPATGVFDWMPAVPGVYSITIRVMDDGVPALSDAETITVSVTAPSIAVPILLAPPNGTITTAQAITFAWQAGAGGTPDGYNLQLDGHIVTTTATLSPAILSTGLHSWSVRAFNSAGYSAWATPWTIEVIRHRTYLPVVLK